MAEAHPTRMEKAVRLGGFRGAASEPEMRAALSRIRRLDREAPLGRLFSPGEAAWKR
jgi:hypothetical protein